MAKKISAAEAAKALRCAYPTFFSGYRDEQLAEAYQDYLAKHGEVNKDTNLEQFKLDITTYISNNLMGKKYD